MGTGELYMTSRNHGCIPGTSSHDLGTDDRSSVVRIGPDEIVNGSEGETSNMLWTFDFLVIQPL